MLAVCLCIWEDASIMYQTVCFFDCASYGEFMNYSIIKFIFMKQRYFTWLFSDDLHFVLRFVCCCCIAHYSRLIPYLSLSRSLSRSLSFSLFESLTQSVNLCVYAGCRVYVYRIFFCVCLSFLIWIVFLVLLCSPFISSSISMWVCFQHFQ